MIEIAPIPPDELEFDEAWLYCATLTHNGKYNWRMPTENEYLDYDEIPTVSFDENDCNIARNIYQPICPVRDIDD